MNKQAFIDLLALRCENRIDSDFANIVNLEATLVQETEIEANGRFMPWFLESEWANASTLPNEERVTLPLNFLAEIEGQVLQIQIDGVWKDLEKQRYDEMIKTYRTESSGVPVTYDFSGFYIVFAPKPDQIYPLRMRYYQRDTAFNTLNATEENLILKHASDWLLACTGRVIAAEHLHNEQLTQKFATQKEEAFNRVYQITEAREHANRNYRMEG